MSDHDIQLLAIGIAIGVDLMVLVQMTLAILDDLRGRKALAAAEAKLEAAREKADA